MVPPSASAREPDHGRTLISALWPPPAPQRTVTILRRDGTRDVRLHGELLDEAEGWAGALASRGVAPGDSVGLITGTDFDFIVACLAIWRAGGVVVPFPPPSRRMSREGWATTTTERLGVGGVRFFIGDARGLLMPDDVVRIDHDELRGATQKFGSGEVRPDDLALIQFTSGSTAAPKGIVFRHKTLEGRLRRDGGSQERHQLRLTPLHFGGVSGSIGRPLAYGWDLTLISPRTFIAKPGLWLREISERGVTNSSAPNFAFALATRELNDRHDRYDLSGWETIGCGAGEGADLDIIFAFAEAGASHGLRPEALSTHYASTEAGRISARRPGTGLRVEVVDRDEFRAGRAIGKGPDGMSFVSSGFPYEDVDVRVVGEGNGSLQDREVGEFQVRSPYLFDGYLGGRASAEVETSDGWLKTGDLGFVADGELFITGRKKDVIIVHGQNFHASDIEDIVRREADVGRSAAFAVRSGGSDVLVIAVEHDDGDVEVARSVSTGVWKETGLSVKEVVLVRPGSLPVTDTGKLQRSKARDLYESGELQGLDR